MDMNHLKESEKFLIQQGLKALAEKFVNSSEIFEEAYNEVTSDDSESLRNDMERNVRLLKNMAQECEDLSIKISNYNKGE